MPGSFNARDISKSYAAVQVLDRVSLVVAPGDRVGIVGPNGIGKSTLLRVLAGLEPPDTGRVISTGAVGYLPQELDAQPQESVRDYLARRTGVGAAELELDSLAARLADEHELAVGRRSDRELGTLSGGEAARAALAAILLSRFDVFLLDEPTNNLDFAGLDRLERFLDALPGGVVVVSHDRAFVERP